MRHDAFNLDDALAVLERTPTTLKMMIEGLPETWTNANEGEGTWSPYDVIGHLIHGERTDWIPRARHILARDKRPFEPFDRTAQFTESKGKTIGQLLSNFAELRRENIATLVVHDLDHVAQIARTMAKAYGEATGPWAPYLSILRDRI